MGRRWRKHVAYFSIFLLLVQLFSFSAIVSANENVQSPVEQQRTVTLVGNLQDELGHTGDWDPKATATIMKHEGDGLYTFTGTLPKGTYEYKIAINGSWDENYGAGGRGGNNISLTLQQETEVTFYYNDRTHAIADSTWYTPIPKEKTTTFSWNDFACDRL